MDVLLTAVKKEKIQDYTDVIRQAGCTPKLVDIDIFAVQNAYELNYDLPAQDIQALLQHLSGGNLSENENDIAVGP